jgi:hypothetical protein
VARGGAGAAVRRRVLVRYVPDARLHAARPKILSVNVLPAPPPRRQDGAFQARGRACPPARSCPSRCPLRSMPRPGACGTGGGPWRTRASATDIRQQFTAVRHRACLSRTWPHAARAMPVRASTLRVEGAKPLDQGRLTRSSPHRRPRSRCPTCSCGSTRSTVRPAGACGPRPRERVSGGCASRSIQPCGHDPCRVGSCTKTPPGCCGAVR